MIYLGIDLGTTYSLVAHVNAQGVPVLFPDFHDANEFRTPSLVHVGREGCLVGNSVESVLEDDPSLPHVRFAKLAMGQDEPMITDEKGRVWRPEAISALVLRKLMKDVAAFTAEAVGGVVITVPANFDEAQRAATKQAALMAGLPMPLLIEEPVAAATYYGYTGKAEEETLFVYDLGGGTFDATILQSAEKGLYALSTEGSNTLGGKNIDEALMGLIATEFHHVYGMPPPTDPVAQAQLRRFATAAKLQLCKPGVQQIRRTLLIGRYTLDCLVTRSQFEQVAADLIDDSISVCERCLRQASLDWSLIDRLMLTGGASLLPLVQDKLRRASEIADSHIVTRQPHQAVAYGAALIADKLFRKSAQGAKLQRISSWELGIRVIDPSTRLPKVQVLIPRNAALPAEKKMLFHTNRAEQTRMIIEVVQQKGLGEEEKSLGHFAFGPITQPRIKYPVEIHLAYDEQGMARVTAKDGDTGQIIERLMDEEGIALQATLQEQKDWVMKQQINH